MADRIFTPKTEAEVAQIVRDLSGSETRLRIRGGGSRQTIGRASQHNATLDLSALSGITLYEPSEMVIGAWAGTPLRDIEAALDAEGQMLTFQPMDHRALLGTKGEPTIGAIAAGNISGPRRIYSGAARDSLIGVRFVNGRGEVIKNGGRVMKNVTGLDLVKLQAGAWGTLGVLTEVIFKVLPKPDVTNTLIYPDLDDQTAVQAMCAALGTPFEVTGAAHQPGPGNDKPGSKTCLRIEGTPESVAYRLERLTDALSGFGTPTVLTGQDSDGLWISFRDVHSLVEPKDHAVWRVSLAPTQGPDFVAASGALNYIYDWSGGLVWMSLPEGEMGQAARLHALAAKAGGHATLIRGSEAYRTAVDVFQPQPAPIAQLSKSIKNSFDPGGLLNPGLMVAEA